MMLNCNSIYWPTNRYADVVGQIVQYRQQNHEGVLLSILSTHMHEKSIFDKMIF